MFQTNTFLDFIKNSDISSKIRDSVFNYCEHHHSFLCQCIYDYDVYKKRLLDVGIHEAAGVNNWVDDKYIRPFYFAKGSLQKDETFTISTASFSHKLLFSNKDLFMDLIEGKYDLHKKES